MYWACLAVVMHVWCIASVTPDSLCPQKTHGFRTHVNYCIPRKHCDKKLTMTLTDEAKWFSILFYDNRGCIDHDLLHC